MDYIIFFMFGLLFSFCVTGAVYFSVWMQKSSLKHWYLGTNRPAGQGQYDPNNPGFVGFASFITSFILYGAARSGTASRFAWLCNWLRRVGLRRAARMRPLEDLCDLCC